MIQSLLDKAKSYLGTTQGDRNHKELIDKYNMKTPLPVGYKMKYTDDWCAAFVTVIGDLTNASNYIGRECGVQRFIQIFKRNKVWQGLAKPKPGDLVVFDWRKDGWADHIGIVEKFDGTIVTVIEGNTSRIVARRTYKYNDWRISGYARPNYPSSVSNPKSEVTASTHDIASEVILGKWNNGDTRARLLKEAGHDPKKIQVEVNKILKARSEHLKTNEDIAKEVIQGKWKNGQERKDLLSAAGYNHSVIQAIVNKLN